MKHYIVEKKKSNVHDGRYNVVVEGETHLNRTIITSSIQFYTTEGGYNYNHPWQRAKANAQAIADGLNGQAINAELLEALKQMTVGMDILSRKNPKHKGMIQDIQKAKQAIKNAEGK